MEIFFLTAGGDDKGDQDDPLGHLLPRHQGQGPHQVCQPRKFRFLMHFETHSELKLIDISAETIVVTWTTL